MRGKKQREKLNFSKIIFFLFFFRRNKFVFFFLLHSANFFQFGVKQREKDGLYPRNRSGEHSFTCSCLFIHDVRFLHSDRRTFEPKLPISPPSSFTFSLPPISLPFLSVPGFLSSVFEFLLFWLIIENAISPWLFLHFLNWPNFYKIIKIFTVKNKCKFFKVSMSFCQLRAVVLDTSLEIFSFLAKNFKRKNS